MTMFSLSAWGLVSQPLPILSGESVIDYRLTREGGVMKPSQDKDSFQSANIIISQLTYRTSLGSSVLNDPFVSIDYRFFSTPKEKSDGVNFHNSSIGHQVILGAGFNIVRTSDYTMGVFAKVSPLLDIDEEKFANPRADLFQIGWNGGFIFGTGAFFESGLIYGSGIPDNQNQYIVLSQVIGKRTSNLIYKLGPYVETDIEERVDKKYSAEYGPQNRSEKIRLYKMGIIAEIGIITSLRSSFSLTYLQKIYGQYLPSTNALSAQYSYKF